MGKLKCMVLLCLLWTTCLAQGTKQKVFPQSAYRTWLDAESSCRKDGLGLLLNLNTVTSSALTELEGSITDSDPYWTGGYRLNLFYWNYGCFTTDSVGIYMETFNTETNNSVAQCAIFCGDRKRWIGLLNNFCYCLNDPSNGDTPLVTSQCRTPCPGEKRDTCGDKQAMSVYKLLNGTEIADDIADERLKDNQRCAFITNDTGTMKWKVDDCAQKKFVLCENKTATDVEFKNPHKIPKDWGAASQDCRDRNMEMAVVTLKDINRNPINNLPPNLPVWIGLYRQDLSLWTNKDLKDDPTNCRAVEKDEFGDLATKWRPCSNQYKYVCLSEGASSAVEPAVIGTPAPTTMSTEQTTIPTTQQTTIPTTQQTTIPTTQQTTIPTTQQTTTERQSSIPKSKQTTDPTTEQTTISTTEQTTDPTTEQTSDPTTEQTTDPTTEQTSTLTTEQTTIPTTEQTTESSTTEQTTESSTTEQTTDPTTEQTTESSTTEQPTDPTTEQTTDPTTEQTSTLTTEQTTDPTTEQTTDPTTEQTTDPTTEQTTIPTTEQTTIPTTEQTTDPTTEQTTESSTTEQTTDPTTEQTSDPTTEQTSTLTTEQTTIPTTEQTTIPTTEQTTIPTTEQTTIPTTEQTTVPTTEQTSTLTTEQTTVPTTKQITDPTTEQTTDPTSEPTTKSSTSTTTTSRLVTTKVTQGDITDKTRTERTISQVSTDPSNVFTSTSLTQITTKIVRPQLTSITTIRPPSTVSQNISDTIEPNGAKSSTHTDKVPTAELIVVIIVFAVVVLLAAFVFIHWLVSFSVENVGGNVTLNRRRSTEITFRGEDEMLIRSHQSSRETSNLSPKPLPRIDIEAGSLEVLSNIPDNQQNQTGSNNTLDIPWIDASRNTLDNISHSRDTEPPFENIGAKYQSAPELDRIGDDTDEEDDTSSSSFMRTFSKQNHPVTESEI